MIRRLASTHARQVAFVALVALCALAAAWAWAPAAAMWRARSASNELSAALATLEPTSISRERIGLLKARLTQLGSDVDYLRSWMDSDPVIAAAAGLWPISTQRSDTRRILAGAHELSVGGGIFLDLAHEFAARRDGALAAGVAVLPELIDLLGTSLPRIEEAATALTRAEELLQPGPAAWPAVLDMAAIVRRPIDRYGPLVTSLRDAARIIPGVAGWNDSRRYLVLAQNPAELRPTGGYIGTVGTITFTDGALTERNFMDVYLLDLVPGVPHQEPPAALANHLLGDASWQLADANWSPDFPTAAKDALRLYSLESGDSDIQGVLALTTHAVDRLLAVLGPVEVPEYGVTVRPGEVTLTALRLTRGVSTPDQDRKAFLDVLAGRVLDRVFDLPADRWPALFEAFSGMGETRELQVWLADEQAQALVERGPLGGSVNLHQDADYVYAVEANVAPTSKYNMVVSRTDVLTVQLDHTGNATAQLEMRWRNAAMTPGQPYQDIRQYSTSVNGMYGAYIRVLTSAGTELLEASGQALDHIGGAESVAVEAGRNSFGNYLLIGPDGAALKYRWRTPSAASGNTWLESEWVYRLAVQKQPGASTVKLKLTVELPADAVITNAPEGSTIAGPALSLAIDLTKDVVVEVRYRLAGGAT